MTRSTLRVVFATLSALAVLSTMLLPASSRAEGEALWKEDQKVLDVLKKVDDFDFEETRLKDLVTHLREYYKLEVRVDERTFAEHKVPGNPAITFRAKQVSLGTALDYALRNAHIGYYVEEGALQITTAKRLKKQTVERIYPIADLIGDNDEWRTHHKKVLRDIVTALADPEQWAHVGGPSDLYPIPPGNTRSFFVVGTREVHRKIPGLLSAIRTVCSESDEVLPVVDMSMSSKAKQKMEKALQSPATFVFDKLPLPKVATFLEENCGMNVFIEESAFGDKKPADIVLSGSADGTPLGAALNKMLAEHELEYRIDDEILVISSLTDDFHYMPTKAYNLKAIMPKGQADRKGRDRYISDLIDTIKMIVYTYNWDDVGGPACAAPAVFEKHDLMIVCCNPKMHAKIRQLLLRKEFSHGKWLPEPERGENGEKAPKYKMGGGM